MGSQSGSESDTSSDSDSSRSSSWSSSQGRASSVRIAALTCLQQLAKADCRALHPFWIVLLPVYNPLQTKYHAATLMDAIVRDPIPKVSVKCSALTLLASAAMSWPHSDAMHGEEAKGQLMQLPAACGTHCTSRRSTSCHIMEV